MPGFLERRRMVAFTFWAADALKVRAVCLFFASRWYAMSHFKHFRKKLLVLCV